MGRIIGRLPTVLLILMVLVPLAGCGVVGGIFKAGMGVGVVIVVIILALIVLFMRKGKGGPGGPHT